MTPLHALGSEEREAIARVWAAALSDGPAGAERPDLAALRHRLATDLRDCHAAALRVDGEIVAFVLCDLDRRWLRQLFVDPRHQGGGLGTRLLDLARQAMPSGWLRTDAANARARRFYAGRGLHVQRIGPHPRHGAPVVEFAWP